MEGYYTVTEYAAKTGRDPGNIRRMLIQGRLKGEKLGKQWIITADQKYPADARIRSGNYLSWRKLNRFNSENRNLKPVIETLTGNLREIYGWYLQSIILYGSYARGTQTEESDIDIALLLHPGYTWEMHDRMMDILVDLELEYGIVLSVVTVDTDDYNNWSSNMPFYRNIKKEGIVLWNTV